MMIIGRRWRGREGKVQWSIAWWWRRAYRLNSPRSLLPSVSFTCCSCFMVLFTKKKVDNHIVEINKDPRSLKIWGLLRHQIQAVKLIWKASKLRTSQQPVIRFAQLKVKFNLGVKVDFTQYIYIYIFIQTNVYLYTFAAPFSRVLWPRIAPGRLE